MSKPSNSWKDLYVITLKNINKHAVTTRITKIKRIVILEGMLYHIFILVIFLQQFCHFSEVIAVSSFKARSRKWHCYIKWEMKIFLCWNYEKNNNNNNYNPLTELLGYSIFSSSVTISIIYYCHHEQFLTYKALYFFDYIDIAVKKYIKCQLLSCRQKSYQ